MTEKKVRIVVLGSMIYDCVVWADRLPKKGETVVGNKNGFFFGGKGANQAVQAAKMGAEVYMISKVGDDREGVALLENLKKNGVNTDFVKVDKEHSSDLCSIHVDKNGDNSIIISIDAGNQITTEDILEAQEIIKSADIFLTQLEVNLNTVEYALKLANKWGVKTVLNPAPPREVPEGLFEYADFLTPNETEAEFFAQVDQEDTNIWCEKIGDRLLKLGPKAVIVTLGEKGAYYTDGLSGKILPAFEINPVDTTAAGDAFNACLSVKLGEGAYIGEALVYANAAGSLAATREGAQSSLAVREEINVFVKKNRLAERK
jgi:ribokinase